MLYKFLMPDKLEQEALDFIKKKENYKKIVERFAGKDFVSEGLPISLFMAGSPGAGKTEISKRLVETFEVDRKARIVRIDPDEIREPLPGYNGNNSNLFQGACSIGVEKIHDYVLSADKSFLLDGTFSNYERAKNNIERSLNKRRFVTLVYVYQDPLIAWELTEKREALDGRFVPKDAFIRHFFGARDTVNKIKIEFGNAIQAHLIERNMHSPDYKIQLNIKNVDDCVDIKYTEDTLKTSI